MPTLSLKVHEFRAIERTVAMLDPDGEEELRFSLFDDGEIGFAVDRNGENGIVCRLQDWLTDSLAEAAATREP